MLVAMAAKHFRFKEFPALESLSNGSANSLLAPQSHSSADKASLL
jgi:hypothetical protein